MKIRLRSQRLNGDSMKKTLNKDIGRTIARGKKRFISISLITALGVTILAGLNIACEDLRYSADRFFDEQRLYDISVVSTLGLTEEDVEALASLEYVDTAEGAYSATVYAAVESGQQAVQIKTLSESGMNAPYVIEGELPQNANEIAVTENYIHASGMEIGDTLTFETDEEEETAEETGEDGENTDLGEELSFSLEEEEEEPVFENKTYTITAVVIDPADINNPEGAVSFRNTTGTKYTFFVLPQAVNSEIYTEVYLKLKGSDSMFCYSEEYETYIDQVVNVIESEIQQQREQARYDSVTGEAYEKLADAQQEVSDKFDEIDQELADARAEIEDGWQEIEDGEEELDDAEKEADEAFAQARQEIEDGYAQLAEGSAQLDEAEKTIADEEGKLAQARTQLEQQQAQAQEQLAAARSQLEESRNQAESTQTELTSQVKAVSEQFGEAWPQEVWDAYLAAAREAYLPVSSIQFEQAQLQAQMASMDEASEEYAQAAAQLAELQAQAEQALAAVEELTAEAKETFLSAFSPLQSAALAQVEQQIEALDPESEGYEQELAALQEKQQQLLALPDSLVQLALGSGQASAALETLEGQLTALEEEAAAAQAQFDAAKKQIEDGAAQLEAAKKEIEEGRAQIAENTAQLQQGEQELKEQEESARAEIADGRAELEDGKQELLDGEEELEQNEEEYKEAKEEVCEQLADARAEIEDIDMTQWYVQERTSLSGYANVDSDAGSIEAIAAVFPLVFLIVAILISLTTMTRMVEEDRGLIGTYKALGFTNGEIRRKYVLYALAAVLSGGVLGNILGFIVLPKILFIVFETLYILPYYDLRFSALYGIGGVALFAVGIAGAAALACRTELKNVPAQLMRPKAPRSGSRVLLERITPLWKRLSFLNKVTARNLFRYKKRLIMTIVGIAGCTGLLLFGFALKDSVTELMPKQYEEVYQYDVLAAAAAEDNDKLLSYMEDENVQSYLNVAVETVTLKNADGQEESLQLIAVPQGESLEGYITLESTQGVQTGLSDDGILVTQNAAQVLDFDRGDTVYLQNLQLTQAEAVVSELVKNYLGNNVYMTQAVYEELFGEFKPNGVLVRLSASCEDQLAFADELAGRDGVVSCMSTEEMKEDFSAAFTLINMVVYIIILMAAGLAFAVLFTLSTTNISERSRELATIKVLGFYDREVHLYVNKETLLLTLIGIVLGMPLGQALSSMLTYVLNMPSIYLAVTIYTQSYGYAAAISFVFALVIDLITNRSLDAIDPVEALKSVE